MKYLKDQDVLTIQPSGEIDSVSASKVEEEINAILQKEAHASVVFDFEEVKYVSSAGLRVILKCKQKEKDVCIINASNDVYDVLQMTGFTNMMSIKKKNRIVSVEGCPLIGEGYFSLVYRLDRETIIKVCRWETDLKEVERELNLAKEAFILGIPTAISYDVVKVDNRWGVVFEMLDCASLRDCFRDQPDHFDDLVKKYAALVKTINTTETMNPSLPDAKKCWLEKAETVKKYIDEPHYAKLARLLSSVPDRETFVHGDVHFKNIMVQGEDLYLIDMDTLSKGHPIFELAAIYAPYIAFEEDDPGNSERFLGVSAELAKNVFKSLIKSYFGEFSEDVYRKIALVSYCHMVWWNRVNESENNVRLEGCRDRLVALLDQYEDLDIGI